MPLYEPKIEPEVNCFRLTGVSGVPVMTTDSTALSTIYLTPFTGNRIALYNGASWNTVYSGEVSLALTSRTTDLPFDIYAFSSSSGLTLETLNWSSATSRATPLVRVDGVWTRTGDPTRRYVGTCRPRSATTFSWVTQGVDAPARLDLWNASNRVRIPWGVEATANTWTYTSQTWRQCQGSSNFQCDLMAGLAESVVTAQVVVSSANSSIIPTEREVGIGFDATNANSSFCMNSGVASTGANVHGHSAQLELLVPIGAHFLAWLENSDTGGTTTWYGDNNALRAQSGISGVWFC